MNRPHILILGVKLSDLLPLVHADQPVPLDSYPDVRLLSNNYEAATHYEFQQGARSLILEISGNCVELNSSDKSAVLVIRDVTQASQAEAERLQAEEIRRQREEQFRTLIGHIPGAVYRGAADEVWIMEFLSDAIASCSWLACNWKPFANQLAIHYEPGGNRATLGDEGLCRHSRQRGHGFRLKLKG